MVDYVDNYVEQVLQKLKLSMTEKKISSIDGFLKADTDKDFKLSKEEFTVLLKDIDSTLTAYEITVAFNKFDTNKNNSIDYSEFYTKLYAIVVPPTAVYVPPTVIKEEQAQVSPKKLDEFKAVTPVEKQKTYAEVAIEKLKEAISMYNINVNELFTKYDTTGDNSIDINEFGTLITVIEPNLPLMDILATFAMFDKDKNYQLSLAEFQAVLKK